MVMKNDPFSHLRLIDHVLSESMYLKDLFKPSPDGIAKPLTPT